MIGDRLFVIVDQHYATFRHIVDRIHPLDGMQIEHFILFPGDGILSKEILVQSDNVEEAAAGRIGQLAEGLQSSFPRL